MEITIPWTNDIICYARQFPRNPKGQYQTERDGAVASATPKGGIEIGSMPVGTKVKLTVNGTDWDFLIVHQGNPDVSLYDASCDGTWLLMEDIYESRQWHSSKVNDYENSTIHSYLNGTFLGLFDADIQAAIKQVKIPYVNGTGSSAVASGASGLDAKIFLLSGYEVGFNQSINSYFPIDGAKLDYFQLGNSSESTARSLRIAYLNGTATYWWLRSPYTNNTGSAWGVYSDGGCSSSSCSFSYGVRPALILNSNTLLLVEPNADGSYSLL
jgi:hypothetical protein